jgi:hypothetical protein
VCESYLLKRWDPRVFASGEFRHRRKSGLRAGISDTKVAAWDAFEGSGNDSVRQEIIMKPSIHPPLYLLVAVTSFFLGTVADSFGKPARSAPEETHTERSTHAITDVPDKSSPNDASAIATDQRTQEAHESQSTTAREDPTDAGKEPLTLPQSGSPVATSAVPVLKSRLGKVEIFTANNEWNRDISDLPVHRMSRTWLRAIGPSDGLHPDFGTVWRGSPIGIPFVVVDSDQPKVKVKFEYDDESDPGPYPIPKGVPIEGGLDAPYDSDRHIIMIDPKKKLLYELFQAIPDPVFGWRAGSGAIFDLSSDDLRPDGWTSADAAGLPVFPGLVRYDEVADGEIRHALRFTVERTQRAYIHPARHFASRHTDPTLPPMGLRVRLRADYDISEFPRSAQIVLIGLKKYGMLLADNGSDWFISGAPDPRWKDRDLATLKRVKGQDFECVYTGPLKK